VLVIHRGRGRRDDDRWKRERETSSKQTPKMASSLGEEVIFCKLIRDNILSHFNPARASDLEYVLELRCYKGLLSDEDLRSCFERLWARGTGYILQEWDSMSADEIRAEIVTHVKGKDSVGLPHTCVGVPVGFESMTKDDLKRYFGALRYVPLSIWLSRFRGLRVLEELSGRVPSHILYRHSFKVSRPRTTCGHPFSLFLALPRPSSPFVSLSNSRCALRSFTRGGGTRMPSPQ